MGMLRVVVLLSVLAGTAGGSLRMGGLKDLSELESVLVDVSTLCGSILATDLVRGLRLGYSQDLQVYDWYNGSSSQEKEIRRCANPEYIVNSNCSCAALNVWAAPVPFDLRAPADSIPHDPIFTACRLRRMCPAIKRQLTAVATAMTAETLDCSMDVMVAVVITCLVFVLIIVVLICVCTLRCIVNLGCCFAATAPEYVECPNCHCSVKTTMK